MNDIAIFTVCSRNYLAYTRSLFGSASAFHTDVDYYCILVDEFENESELKQDNFHVIEVNNINIRNSEELFFKYDILELNTAIKPFGFKYLFSKGYKKILYFDSDIYIYNRLDDLFEKLEKYSTLLTPHIISPMTENDDLLPSEQSFLSAGIYNLGFIAFSNTLESMNFIDWWSERCHEACYNEIETGLFVDQKWVDFLPVFIEKILIIRDPGYNMAYWNLHERFLQGHVVNKHHPLIFFHFSGYDINNIDIISRYQTRFKLEEREDLRELFVEYKNRLLENGYEKYKKYAYKYEYYSNGEAIGRLARRMYPAVKYRFKDPFSVAQGSYYNYLKKLRLLEKTKGGTVFIENQAKQKKVYEILIRGLIKIIGVDRYMYLIENIRYISTPRRQDFLVRRKWTR